jgi:hypothetical protein
MGDAVNQLLCGHCPVHLSESIVLLLVVAALAAAHVWYWTRPPR